VTADAAPDDGVDAIAAAVARLAGRNPAPAVAAPDPEPEPEAPPGGAVWSAADVVRMVEALLFAASEPLDARSIAARLPEGSDVGAALAGLKQAYAGRGVELAEVAGKWRFQTAADLGWLLVETRQEPRRLSKAALETLAVIAYHQPCTRAEIEEVRGVAVGKGTLDTLIELGWVRPRGRRRSPGRPLTFGTTDVFLAHFGLISVDDLPGKEDLKAAGLLDPRFPSDIDVPRPRDPDAVDLAEDPLAPDDDFHRDFLDAGSGQG
jgi:segregation and condensation protein B